MSTIEVFDFSVDLIKALLWQYDNTVKLKGLLEKKLLWYDENYTFFWQDWYDNVFNLLTANTFGLAVWSIILDIPLFINQIDESGKPLFGFNAIDGSFPTYLNNYKNFENGNFTSQSSPIHLTVEQQRLILRLRYYQLVSRGDVIETNRFLKELFADFGDVYMLDGLDMSIVYVFTFDLDPSVLVVLQNYDVLPRPAGVRIRYVISSDYIFGFNAVDGAFPNYINTYRNFENGNFIGSYFTL